MHNEISKMIGARNESHDTVTINGLPGDVALQVQTGHLLFSGHFFFTKKTK